VTLPECDRMYICADLLGLTRDATHALLALACRRRRGVPEIQDQDLAALATLVAGGLVSAIYEGRHDDPEGLLNLRRYRFEIAPSFADRLA
jgi:hypothetical protein